MFLSINLMVVRMLVDYSVEAECCTLQLDKCFHQIETLFDGFDFNKLFYFDAPLNSGLLRILAL